MLGDGYVTIMKVKKEVNENNYFEHIFFTQTFPERETANVKRERGRSILKLALFPAIGNSPTPGLRRTSRQSLRPP
jgi:hypothetical protein